MVSVYSAKLPNAPSYTHINPFSFSFLFSLHFFATCPSLPHCYSRTPPVVFPACHPSVHPSYLLFFDVFVQLWVSVREARRVGMAAWHKHTRLPISPPGCPRGGLGNLYLLYILPHLTRILFCLFLMLFLNLFYKYSPAVLWVNLALGPVFITSKNYI